MTVDWDQLWKTRARAFNRWPSEDLVSWASTLKPGSKVLEVGCGAGPNLRALESFGHEAWGVDLSSEVLEASRALSVPSHATVVTPVSATDLPFGDGEFDAVCDVQCFQHLEQSELVAAYAEAARVLKPRGRFFEMFLVKGQENFPDLDFCEFTSTPMKLAGFEADRDGSYYLERTNTHPERTQRRRYRYFVLHAVLDSSSTLTR